MTGTNTQEGDYQKHGPCHRKQDNRNKHFYRFDVAPSFIFLLSIIGLVSFCLKVEYHRCIDCLVFLLNCSTEFRKEMREFHQRRLWVQKNKVKYWQSLRWRGKFTLCSIDCFDWIFAWIGKSIISILIESVHSSFPKSVQSSKYPFDFIELMGISMSSPRRRGSRWYTPNPWIPDQVRDDKASILL